MNPAFSFYARVALLFGLLIFNLPAPARSGDSDLTFRRESRRGSSAINPAMPGTVPKGLTGSDWSSIKQEYERHSYAAFPIAGGHQARNPGQQWLTRFDGR